MAVASTTTAVVDIADGLDEDPADETSSVDILWLVLVLVLLLCCCFGLFCYRRGKLNNAGVLEELKMHRRTMDNPTYIASGIAPGIDTAFAEPVYSIPIEGGTDARGQPTYAVMTAAAVGAPALADQHTYTTLNRGSGAQRTYNTLDRGSEALYQDADAAPLERDTVQARTDGAVANDTYATVESNAQGHTAYPRLADNPIYVGPADSDGDGDGGYLAVQGDAETHA